MIEAVISIGSRPRRHQAYHHAGESFSQAVSRRKAHDESESSPHHDPHTHTPTQLDLCPAILCSPRANSGLIAEAVRSHQGAIKSP